MPKIFSTAMAALFLLTVVAAPLAAAPAPSDPKKQTSWGLYVTAKEAYDMKSDHTSEVLLVDVRDPIEIMFTGFSDAVDANVPFLLSNPGAWNDKKSVFLMERNPDFVAGLERALAAQGLDKTAPIVLMCRSGGTRGAPSANTLQGLGFEKVYVVVDGFEGSTVKDNPNGPWRLKNGWKNSGLPWSYTLNQEKMYFRGN
jgi:rhodanese-related sulfurtransferase